MRRNNSEPDYEVFAPSRGTNHLLDPTKVSGLLGPINTSLNTTEGNKMRARLEGDLSVDKKAKDGFKLKPAFIATGASSPYGLGTKDGNKMLAGLNELKSMPKHDPQYKGGGPKSTLRTPKKFFSSFGRGVPYSGGLTNFFKSQSAGPALGLGRYKHFIPDQGIFHAGINAGPKMFQGMGWNGAFPILNFQQFNMATGATPHDSEEED